MVFFYLRDLSKCKVVRDRLAPSENGRSFYGVGRPLEVCIESGSLANLTLRLLQGFRLLSKCEPLTTQAHPFGTNRGITLPSLTRRSFLTQDNSRFDEYRLVSWHIAGDECQTRKEQRSTQQQHRIRCARACHGGEQRHRPLVHSDVQLCDT
jgi:hypothetical protein